MRLEFIESDEYKCPVCDLPAKTKVMLWAGELMSATLSCPKRHEWAVGSNDELKEHKIERRD